MLCFTASPMQIESDLFPQKINKPAALSVPSYVKPKTTKSTVHMSQPQRLRGKTQEGRLDKLSSNLIKSCVIKTKLCEPRFPEWDIISYVHLCSNKCCNVSCAQFLHSCMCSLMRGFTLQIHAMFSTVQ